MAALVDSMAPHARMRVMLTASEAFPVLEQAFLSARHEIWASFRIFDLRTKLRSAEAKKIGTNWFDLIVHTLKRGVAIRMVISDFDPFAWAAGHRATWRSVRMFIAAAEVAGPSSQLRIVPAMHPARTGLFQRMVFWPIMLRRLAGIAQDLNHKIPEHRRTHLRSLPGIRRWLLSDQSGLLRPRYLSLPPICPATHHQKLAVFDRRRVYIGGLDLDERRFDTPQHDRDSTETWHDVQLMIEGSLASEAQRHLETFLDVTAGRVEPAPQQQLLRTLSRPRRGLGSYFGPETVAREILAAHAMLARRTEDLIYIETQYFRSRRLAHILAQVARRRPDLSMILILPGAPDDVAFEENVGLDARFGEFLQARALRILQQGFGRRLFVGGAAQPRRAHRRSSDDRDRLEGAPIIYIHAKVSIFDDSAAIVSSANLNGRSLKWDTEAGVLLNAPEDVGTLKRRVMAHWLHQDAGPGFFEGRQAVEHWRALSLENARSAPECRKGFLLPYDLKAAEAFGQAVPAVPEELV